MDGNAEDRAIPEPAGKLRVKLALPILPTPRSQIAVVTGSGPWGDVYGPGDGLHLTVTD
jgi:hypothetical protein